jgi:hypothetical protein
VPQKYCWALVLRWLLFEQLGTGNIVEGLIGRFATTRRGHREKSRLPAALQAANVLHTARPHPHTPCRELTNALRGCGGMPAPAWEAAAPLEDHRGGAARQSSSQE